MSQRGMGNESSNVVANESGEELPDLRFHDTTPITKSNNKRGCAEMSPIQEQQISELMSNEVWNAKIEEMIIKSVNNAVPKIIESVVTQIQSTMIGTVKQVVDVMKEEIIEQVSQDIQSSELRTTLRARCEAELLENYNRRDNLKIFGLDEKTHVDDKGNTRPESTETTMENVLQLAKTINADIDVKDISIAHRLPTKKGVTRPIIVKLARRVAKIDILKKKRVLKDSNSPIKVYEDITAPRAAFLSLMKSDTRLSGAYTREGTIFYTMHHDNNIYKINNLYDGSIVLNYHIKDIESCFRW